MRASAGLRGSWRAGLFLFGCFLFCNLRWVINSFGSPTLDQILYHLTYETGGLTEIDPKIFRSYFIHAILAPVFLSGVLILMLRFFRKRSQRVADMAERVTPLLVLACCVLLAEVKIGIASYLYTFLGPDFVASHYVMPVPVEKNPRRLKNLVLIYVEGLDAAYESEEIFGKNLVKEISALKGVRFDDYHQVPGTGWTMAGIASSQCAIPLKAVTFGEVNSQMESVRAFLPNAVCLGDTLKDFGYQNLFLGGASLDFSGKGNFLRTHGYESVFGKEEWLSSGRYRHSEMNAWGLNDDDLFDEARAQIDRLQADKGLFNLTLLTVSTHPGEGYLTERCKAAGGKSFQDIVSCSSVEVASFVRYMEAKGYLANTNVVILGDHLAMTNPVSDQLAQPKTRSIFNRWISKEITKKNRETILHFDIAPSILDFIGIESESGRYGLGYSAFSEKKEMPPVGWIADIEKNVMNQSSYYSGFWKPATKSVAAQNVDFED
jgi:phosphoglycerol transferase